MSKIKLIYNNGKALTFNKEDYMIIRRNYRIKGELIGSVPHHFKNSKFHSLPAIYSIYETKLLYEKDFIELIDKSSIENVTCFMQDEYNKIIDEIRNEQDFINSENISEKSSDKDFLNSKKIKDMRLTEIPREHPFLLEYNQKNTSEIHINPLKYKVYCKLWEKEKYITDGNSFGCDFMVYPGDPIQFHASHIVYIIKSDRKCLSTKLITNLARLSINVNKKCVIAYYNEQTDEINLQQIKWMGNN